MQKDSTVEIVLDENGLISGLPKNFEDTYDDTKASALVLASDCTNDECCECE